MKLKSIIKLQNKNFPIPKLIGGKDIGFIALKDQTQIPVYYKTVSGSAIEHDFIAHLNNEILGFLVCIEIPTRPNIWMAKMAQSYQKGENIFYSLIRMVKDNFLNIKIISDVEMSDSGERAWQKISKDPSLNVKLYNFDENKIYNIGDPNTTMPEDDVTLHPEDVTWFYIIECGMPFPGRLGLYEYYRKPSIKDFPNNL